MKFFIIFALLLFLKTSCAEKTTNHEDLKLELVQVLFRHGARTILEIDYHSYPYLNKSVYEPYGFGQLTNRGKKMMYDVGSMLRQRYNGFLNNKYNSEDVYAYSSEDDRTRMSLELVLAGLYPPISGLRWHPNLKWQPIPYRYTPKKLDILMKPHISSRFRTLKTYHMQKEFLKEAPKFEHIFKLLSEELKRPIDATKYLDISIIRNILYVHEFMDLPLPDWYTDEIKKDLREFENIILKYESFTDTQKRINGGTMIKTFVDNMNLHNKYKNPRKIYLYSGHDLTLSGFLRAHNIDAIDTPDFGHTLMFEKFRDSNNTVYVRLVAYNPVEGTTSTLRFGNCDEFCSIHDYTHYVSKAMSTERDMNTLRDEFNFNDIQNLFFSDEVTTVNH